MTEGRGAPPPPPHEEADGLHSEDILGLGWGLLGSQLRGCGGEPARNGPLSRHSVHPSCVFFCSSAGTTPPSLSGNQTQWLLEAGILLPAAMSEIEGTARCAGPSCQVERFRGFVPSVVYSSHGSRPLTHAHRPPFLVLVSSLQLPRELDLALSVPIPPWNAAPD